ncbi:hypothetical protein LTR93_005503 [Exophiala xenobiotica]|nr:hypothetical protein LTR93_005503 [Exophiala xenobiotica]
MGGLEAEHLETKTEIIHDLAVHRQHEQEALAEQLAGEDKKIKRIIRKLDLRLVLTLAILYVWAFIDRGNLANANIAGMGADLGLVGNNRYSILAMIFFVGYILIDAPATFIVRKIGAVVWIPTIVVLWGIITIGQGFCHSWGALLACRVLLGFLEGGLIPAAMFLISVWYTRYEAHTRLASFYVVGIASTGVSGLLAYGIENMDGDAGLEGWRWIFIIEGIATVFCGIAAYFFLVDLPERATTRGLFGLLPPFLTAAEASLIHARIERDRGDSTPEKLTVKKMLVCAKDWKVWEFSSYVLFNNTALYAFAYFLPVILQKSLHYSTSKSQLFTFPPYAVAVPWILFCAWICDKLKVRGPMLVFNSTLYIIGVLITAYCKSPHARYGGVFIGVMGITGNIPTNWAYQQNNVVGQPKRALCAAMMTTGGGIGGIIAGNIFQAKDAPGYRPALIICVAFQAFNILLVCKNFVYFRWANRKADREELIIEGTPDFRDLLRRHEKAVHDGRSCGRYESPSHTKSTSGSILVSSNGASTTTSAISNEPVDQSVSSPEHAVHLGVGHNLPIDPSTDFGQLAPDHNTDSAVEGISSLGFPTAGLHVQGVEQVDQVAVEAMGYAMDTDMYSQFDNFNDFLDLHDFSSLIPPDYAFDLGLQDFAFASDLPHPFHGNSQVQHDSGGHGLRVEQDTSFSRFGSPLPALHFESREQAPRGSGQAEQNANFRRVWKISGPQYRQVVANIQNFAHVLPKDFIMPSRHTMSRFLEGAIKGYYDHLPNLHIPTFSPSDAAPELFLAMCAIGALFRFESHRCPMLFHAAKAIASEQIKRQEKALSRDNANISRAEWTSALITSSDSNTAGTSAPSHNTAKKSESVTDAQVQTLQALLALLCLGAWGPQQELIKEAISLQSLVATMARDDGFSRLKMPMASATDMSDWSSWVLMESRKRTKLMTYCLLQLISVAYHIPPLILNSEIDCCLPCSAREWNASNAQEWQEVRKSSPFREVPFQEAFQTMFENGGSSPAHLSLSPMANYVLILAILQHIYFRRQTLASSKRSLSSDDIGEISRALRCWQSRWEQGPETHFEPSSATGPVAFSSTALLRLAWIRLHLDLGPCRNLASGDASIIASAFKNSPPLKRGPELIHPVLQAAHALSVPVRMGIKYVAKTQTLSWSVQHSFSNLECAIFLSKWLELIAVASSTCSLDKEELVLVQMIQSLLRETGLFDDDMMHNLADRQDHKQKIRWLATAVARMWAEIFKGTHIFEIVNIIGASLTIYAESMETTYTPADQA